MIPATDSNIAHRAVPIKAGTREIIPSATLTNSAARRLGHPCVSVLLIALFAVALSVAPLAAQAPPDLESITTFAADCTTPQTDFNLGDTLCAKLTGAPLGPPVQRVINWTGPFRFIVSSANVVTNPQTELFTIPAPAAYVVNGETVDNRGTWRVSSTATSDASLQVQALFTVHDPAETVADLVVYNSIGMADSDVSVGGNNTSGNLTSKLYVANRGPDTAVNVQAMVPVPADTTFFSLTQDSGPPFTCTTGAGTITCTIPSMAKGDVALFTVVYTLTAATPNMSLTANASAMTTERDNSDNATTPITLAPGGGDGGGSCTTSLTCPANIAQQSVANNDQGVCGAFVTFNTPASSCGTVNCDPPSGSFFPIGATDATCSDDAGNSCSFTVTVLYNFTGFFSPVDNPPALTVVNAGRAIPVKFSLSGNKGLNVLADFPVSGTIMCDASTPPSDVTETLTAGNSSLSYDPATDQYVYVWNTDAAWAGTCRQLVVTLNDGSVHVANFKFR